MMRSSFMSVIAAAFFSAIALSTAPVMAKGTKPSAEPVFQGITINVANGGNMSILSGMFMEDGFVTVCGAYFFSDNASNAVMVERDQVLRKIYFVLDGQSLNVDISKFARYANEAEARKTDKLGCSTTRRAVEKVKKPNSFKIKLAPGYILE